MYSSSPFSFITHFGISNSRAISETCLHELHIAVINQILYVCYVQIGRQPNHVLQKGIMLSDLPILYSVKPPPIKTGGILKDTLFDKTNVDQI